ncbi:AAA family ATPase [Pseudogracilibacillus sp. SO30301A]|uniref:AAA family ATPase n=1 Tax=Pseudogracilibacillus sp. SO30301A TaxID=3098291 RepID=UPI00300DE690
MVLIQEKLHKQGYIADRSLSVTLQLVMELEKPLLVEGPAGVGKTELAKVLASVLETKLIRLQCYEGLDTTTALYEWNYPKQMLYIRMSENDFPTDEKKAPDIFDEQFLLRRPLLDAITEDEKAPVLLIDEIDRADEAFEAFLLEVLGEFQVTIPEWGTIKAQHKPYVILTSNRTRELSDALRRRCLYEWIDYPDIEKETDILRAKLPGIEKRLAKQVASTMQRLRDLPFYKPPGVAESLDWARALSMLVNADDDELAVTDTLGCLVKDRNDWKLLTENIDILREVE